MVFAAMVQVDQLRPVRQFKRHAAVGAVARNISGQGRNADSLLSASVSALNTKVARYFSGSRAAITETDAGDALGLTVALALVVRFAFAFESVFWQAVFAKAIKPMARIKIDMGVLKCAVFILVSEESSVGALLFLKGVSAGEP